MRAIVLVKQVPDLRVGSVGVHPDGTIDRSAAPPITNPTDLHALEAAVQLADEVIALSMGPAAAEHALRDAIAGGASKAVLLSDHAFAGSDTWATANALAAAIRHLGGADMVLCGTSALDGETGQVGPSVAQRLDWPQATGCEAAHVEGTAVVVRRVVEGGYEELRLPLPAVLTVGETGFSPRYPTVIQRRRATTAVVEQWCAADIGLDDDQVGLNASPTKVAHMAPAPLPDRGCRFVGDGFGYDDLAGELVARGAFAPRDVDAAESARSTTDEVAANEGATPFVGTPGVWVVCDTVDGALTRPSRELLVKAAELAPALANGVAAVVLAANPGDAASDAARHGADLVFVAAHPSLSPYRCEPWALVLADAAAERHPDVLLFPATTSGRDLAPRVASMLHTGLAADCTDLTVGDWTRHGVTHERLVHMVRPAMAGGVLATCLCPTARPQMATVRPGVFAVHPSPRRLRMQELPVVLAPTDERVEVVARHTSTADVSLADADVIIAGGAGCTAETWHLVDDLATAIGGRVAASRGAVEAGLAERRQQVGQTGITVRPRLYFACGISGALQHAVGMQDASTIVAVNRDPDAVIFRLAHYGIVGDISEVLPKLTAALRR